PSCPGHRASPTPSRCAPPWCPPLCGRIPPGAPPPRGASAPLSGGAGPVEDRERVAADRELPVSQPLRLRRLALRHREDRLVDAAPHALEGLGPVEDQPGVEIDVVLHARGGV